SWSFVHGVWEELSTTNAPSARAGSALAFDARNLSVVLYGGSGVDASGTYNSYPSYPRDTWTLRDGGWSELAFPGELTPTADTQPGFVYDPDRGGDLLFSWSGNAWLLHMGTAQTPLSVTAQANRTVADAPAKVQFRVFPEGGTPPYQYVWTFGDGNYSVLAAPSHTYAATGTYAVGVEVIDTLGNTSTGNLTVTVHPPPTVTASVAPLDGSAPLNVELTGDIQGGTPPLSVEWAFGDGTMGAVLNTTHTYSTAGNYTVSLRVTDSSGWIGGAGPYRVDVHPGPGRLAASLVVSPDPSYLGQPIRLIAQVAGGAAPFTFTWSGLPAGCPDPNASIVTCVPAEVGGYFASVTVEDSSRQIATAGASVPVLAVPLRVSLAADPVDPTLGFPITLTAKVTGGDPPVELGWSGLPPGCSATADSSFECTPTTVGTFNITVTATDLAGGSDFAEVGVAVVAIATSAHPPVSNLPAELEWLVVGGVVGLGVASLSWFASRRFRRGE
ncbi:MAG TPA: PKD domain-containing protein, partial [Thermoplasmata archaeon]|nr:PKD domain-containing protein [Thermoplasmata archaeon]